MEVVVRGIVVRRFQLSLDGTIAFWTEHIYIRSDDKRSAVQLVLGWSLIPEVKWKFDMDVAS